MVALDIIKQQEYYTLFMFHYVKSVYFCWTKHFNFVLNNCNDLIFFKLFGKLFHIIAPLYSSELLGMIRFFFT